LLEEKQHKLTLENAIQVYSNSKSWKMTAPLRKIHSKLFGTAHKAIKVSTQIVGCKPNAINDNCESRIIKIDKGPIKKEIKDAEEYIEAFRKGKKFQIEHKVIRENKQPVVSVIIPTFNKIEYTLACLKSIEKNTDSSIPLEFIVVNDCSTDETRKILSSIRGIRLINNNQNMGFIGSCNRGARKARGKHLLFLNNDTIVLKDTISNLLKTMELNSVGAVGGMIINPHAKLQEAGSIIWSDGSCLGYGRGKNPEKSEYNFLREVDYCSGALLMTSKLLWNKIGGFDNLYSPGYYEETDYCMKLRKNCYKVIYQHLAKIIHFEFTSTNQDKAISLQRKNHKTFFARWDKKLKTHYTPLNKNILKARTRSKEKRVLYLDDRVPDPLMGSGYPRSYDILNKLIKLGYQITLYPLCTQLIENVDLVKKLQQQGVEIIYNREDFEEFLQSRSDFYDTIFLSRPHNVEKAWPAIQKYNNQAKVIYDAEAIFALREIKYREVNGIELTKKEKEKLLSKEINLIKIAKKTIVVSENEKKIFEDLGVKNVSILGHKRSITPTKTKFEDREGILFVGSILDENKRNPNYDSLKYFIKKVLPLVQKQLKCNFYIVGTNNSKKIQNLSNDHIKVIGRVEDLTKYYNKCRVFVVPTRFAAGIPYKLHEATSFGIPSVITELIGTQMKWKNDKHCLIAKNSKEFSEKIVELYNDKTLWNKLRENSLEDVKKTCDPKVFDSKIERIFLGKERYAFFHIPKTGGTTIRKKLEKHYNQEQLLNLYKNSKMSPYNKPILSKEFVDSLDKEKIKIVFGHTVSQLNLDLLGLNFRKIMFLRNPVDRIVSLYNYRRTTYEKFNECAEYLTILSPSKRILPFKEWFMNNLEEIYMSLTMNIILKF